MLIKNTHTEVHTHREHVGHINNALVDISNIDFVTSYFRGKTLHLKIQEFLTQEKDKDKIKVSETCMFE